MVSVCMQFLSRIAELCMYVKCNWNGLFAFGVFRCVYGWPVISIIRHFVRSRHTSISRLLRGLFAFHSFDHWSERKRSTIFSCALTLDWCFCVCVYMSRYDFEMTAMMYVWMICGQWTFKGNDGTCIPTDVFDSLAFFWFNLNCSFGIVVIIWWFFCLTIFFFFEYVFFTPLNSTNVCFLCGVSFCLSVFVWFSSPSENALSAFSLIAIHKYSW